MRFIPWIHGLRSSAARPPARPRPTRLGVLTLEDRITPDARDIAGLRFNAPGTFAGSSSNATISTAVEVGLVPAAGAAFVPLLSLPAGVAVSTSPASATINSTLSARGLTFTGNNLGFVFDQPNNKFSIAGDASFTAGGVTIGASFGSAIGTPGLVIQSGKLASVDLGVTTSFSFGAVSFNSQDLRLKLDTGTATSTRYAVSGKATATVAGQSSPITLTTQFGESPQEPGLVVVDGKLTDLAVGVSGGFSVGGVTVAAKDLSFAFNSAKNTYGLFGTAGATFTNAASPVNIDLLLGTAAAPGILVTNGKLTALNAGVTSNFNVAGVAINTKALTVTLAVPTNTFTLSGSAGLSFTGAKNAVNFDATFGQSAQQPGLRIVNGTLTDLSVAVTGGFTVAGLTATAKALTFTYNRGLNQYGLSGGLAVSTAPDGAGRRVLNNFGVQLGSAAAPGLVVRNGVMENLDFALNGSITLGPVTATPQNLRVQFARATGVLQFTGGLAVSLASRINASAELTNGGLTINTTTGAVQLNGLRLGVTDTRLGPVNVRSAFIAFATDGQGSFNLSGGATVDLPAGLTVEGSFDVVNGRLRRIMIAVERNPGIPLGNTGVFVTRVTAEVNNLDNPSQLVLSGSVTFTAGGSFRIGGTTVSLIQGTVGVSLDVGRTPLTLDGRISLIGEAIPVARGRVVFTFDRNDPRQSSVRATAEVNLYAGFVRGTIDIDLRATGDLTVIARAEIRIPDIQIPAVVIPGIDFGLLGTTPPTTLFPATRIGGISLASVTITLRLLASDPVNSSVTFSAELLGFISADLRVTFGGQVTVSGRINTGLGPINLGTSRFGIPAIVTDTAPPPATPAPPIRPVGYFPTVRILSAERVANTTNDLRVAFQATTIDTPGATVTLGLGGPAAGAATVRLAGPTAGQTFDPATGIGTLVIRNPDALVTPNLPFNINAAITDVFESGRAAAFGPIAPVFGPLVIVAPASLTVPTGQTVSATGNNRIQITDPASTNDPTARVRVSVATANTLAPRVPAGLRPTVVVEANAGNRVTLVGPTADVNDALSRLTFTRTSDTGADFFEVFASRPDALGGSVSRRVEVPSGLPIRYTIPATAPANVRVRESLFFPFATPAGAAGTLTVAGNNLIDAVRIIVQPGIDFSGTRSYQRGSDFLEAATLPSGLTHAGPIFQFFDDRAGELVLFGANGSETPQQFLDALTGVSFQTTGSPGVLTLQVIISAFSGNGTPTSLTVEKTIAVNAARRVAPPAGRFAAGAFARVADAPLVVDVGTTGGVYVGTGPVAVAPELRVVNADPADPVRTATVAFTGLYDLTSDVLAFTPVGGITGAFDAAAGVLTLTADAATTPEDFEAALRGVTFESTRKNPTPYPRELLFTVTTADGVSSLPRLGTTLLPIQVPTVPPGVTGTTDALSTPPNAAPVAVFPDFDLVYPDEALPPPAVPLGAFIPGTTITRATVAIAAGYRPGEDFLTFTPAGTVTGTFFSDTGELVLDGLGTLADYEQVIRSVQYQNRNTSADTADRTIVVTLDDGSASDNPPTLTRVVRPQSDGLDTVRVSGNLDTLVITPATNRASLGLTDLNYAPRPGETKLVYTILDTPQGSFGTVLLTDGTVAVIGMEVPIEQLRGATYIAAAARRAGTVPFTFSIAGVNPVTGLPTETPLTATVPIQTTNVAPTAVADAFRLPAGAAITTALLDNDTDPNGDVLQVTAVTQPANGTVTRADDGSFRYTPAAGFAGTDTFTYTIIDGAGGTATAAVTLTVVAAAVPPIVPPPPTRPAVALVGFREFAAGADAGGSGATLFNRDGTPRFTVTPFPGFTGGVRTAAADFNGDGVADLVVGTGPGRATRVLVLDGKTQAELFSVDPFEAAFTGGVFVTVGDLNGDGVPELVITPDEGGGPRVDVYSGAGFTKFASFFGIDDPNFRGGARASSGDLNGDGRADLLVVAGFGGGPRVAGFDGKTIGGTPTRVFGDFFAFEQTLRNGIFVTSGDLDGDGFAELIAGGGPGGGPRVTAFSGRGLVGGTQTAVANFFAGNADNRGGVRMAVKDLDNDNRADLVVGSGSGAGSRVTAYLGKNAAPQGTPAAALDFDAFAGFAGFAGGVFVG